MDSLSTAEHIEHLADEYRTMMERIESPVDDAQIRALLIREADWTSNGAAVVLMLAKRYGSFVLANALALAEALQIEDGEAGI